MAECGPSGVRTASGQNRPDSSEEVQVWPKRAQIWGQKRPTFGRVRRQFAAAGRNRTRLAPKSAQCGRSWPGVGVGRSSSNVGDNIRSESGDDSTNACAEVQNSHGHHSGTRIEQGSVWLCVKMWDWERSRRATAQVLACVLTLGTAPHLTAGGRPGRRPSSRNGPARHLGSRV